METRNDGDRPCVSASGVTSDDEVVVCLPRPSQGQRPKRDYASLLDSDGPPILAALVGQPGGRWLGELSGGARSCREALGKVATASGKFGSLAIADDVVVGLAIVQGWHCVRGVASHADTYALMMASQAFHRKRSSPRYLEHKVIAAAMASQGGTFMVTPCRSDALPARVAGVKVIEHLTATLGNALVTKGIRHGQDVPIGQLLCEWEVHYGVSASACVAWPVTFRLALAMASGAWYGDVSVRHRRQLPGEGDDGACGTKRGSYEALLDY